MLYANIYWDNEMIEALFICHRSNFTPISSILVKFCCFSLIESLLSMIESSFITLTILLSKVR